MDLGVTVRLPWASLCLAFPLAGDCGARTAGLQYTLPVMPARPAPIAVEARALDDAVGPGPASPAGFGPALGWVLGVPDSPRRGCRPGRPVDLAEGVRLLTGVRAEVGPERGCSGSA